MHASFKPSPALLVAVIALVGALGGSAIALPGRNAVKSGDVKNGAIKSADLRDAGAVRPQDLHPRTRLWAQVSSDAQLLGASEPGMTVTRTNHPEGGYSVDLGRGDVGPCASLAQITGFAPGGGIPTGHAATELSGSPTTAVKVETTNPDGQLGDRGFTLVVFC